MPTYTTAARVRLLVPTVTSGVLADSTVNSLISDHEAELEVALSLHGYPVPVTTPAALVAWLAKLATEGTAAAVLKSLFQDAGGPNSEAAWTVWEKRYQAGLALIRDGNVVPAATDTSGGAGIRSWLTDYTEDDLTALDEDRDVDPSFTVGMTW